MSPIIADFKMSDDTKEKLQAILQGLSAEDREKLMDALACLSADIQLHIRRATVEELRHSWADDLFTMLSREPRKKASK